MIIYENKEEVNQHLPTISLIDFFQNYVIIKGDGLIPMVLNIAVETYMFTKEPVYIRGMYR